MSLLSFENPVFSYFAFHAGAVVFKTMSMSIITSYKRLQTKFFAKPGDNTIQQTKDKRDFSSDYATIERIRRCHRNDLENVIPFVLLGYFYVLTEPDVGTAALYFRLFTAFRFSHTVVYLASIPQPCRALCFTGGFTINCLMAIAILKKSTF